MRTILKDTTCNLCNHCLDHIATCTHEHKESITFGDGIGNDNVVECSSFQNDGSLHEDDILSN